MRRLCSLEVGFEFFLELALEPHRELELLGDLDLSLWGCNSLLFDLDKAIYCNLSNDCVWLILRGLCLHLLWLWSSALTSS